MKVLKALNIDQANNFLKNGSRNVELDFDFSADEFFRFAEYWCTRGARVLREENFVIRMNKSPNIPPFD